MTSSDRRKNPDSYQKSFREKNIVHPLTLGNGIQCIYIYNIIHKYSAKLLRSYHQPEDSGGGGGQIS